MLWYLQKKIKCPIFSQYCVLRAPSSGWDKADKKGAEKKSGRNSQPSLVHSFTSRYYLLHPYYKESTVLGIVQDADKGIGISEQKDL